MNPNHTLKRETAIRRKKNKTAGRERGMTLGREQMHHAPVLQGPRDYLRVKRLMDVVLATLLFLLTLPLMVLAGLLVRLTSRGPAVYVQTRLGRGGAEFRIFKIRTMLDNCESLTGPRWTLPGDPRITRVGALLRATHVDELPQLWNVIRGDMSLIGPRPERPEIIAKLVPELPDYMERLAVRPGITGLAQVQLPPDSDLFSVADKLVLDRAYIERLGPWLDLKILLCTVLRMLRVGSKRCRFLVRSAIPAGFTPGNNVPRGAARRAA